MSTLEQDKLAPLLFPKGSGVELLNFKLLRTAGDVVSAAFVRDEIHSALVQSWITKQAPRRSDFPRSEALPVSVSAMVAKL